MIAIWCDLLILILLSIGDFVVIKFCLFRYKRTKIEYKDAWEKLDIELVKTDKDTLINHKIQNDSIYKKINKSGTLKKILKKKKQEAMKSTPRNLVLSHSL